MAEVGTCLFLLLLALDSFPPLNLSHLMTLWANLLLLTTLLHLFVVFSTLCLLCCHPWGFHIHVDHSLEVVLRWRSKPTAPCAAGVGEIKSRWCCESGEMMTFHTRTSSFLSSDDISAHLKMILLITGFIVGRPTQFINWLCTKHWLILYGWRRKRMQNTAVIHMTERDGDEGRVQKRKIIVLTFKVRGMCSYMGVSFVFMFTSAWLCTFSRKEAFFNLLRCVFTQRRHNVVLNFNKSMNVLCSVWLHVTLMLLTV